MTLTGAYELPFEDSTFDVVYAHQVLQHLANPVAALREMHRTLKPGGLVGVREVVYSTMQGAPMLPGIHKWREIYMQTARHNGSEPDAGLYLKHWMQAAGLAEVRYTSATVTYTSEDEPRRKAFGESWAERTVKTFGPQAVELGLAENSEISEMESAWKQWAADSDAIFFYVNGESVARKPGWKRSVVMAAGRVRWKILGCSGYIRGDCVASLVLKALEVEDGEVGNEKQKQWW